MAKDRRRADGEPTQRPDDPVATRSPRAKGSSPTSASASRAGWLGGMRVSGFAVIMMGVLVLGVVVLAPTIAAFADQRRQIAELRAEVSAKQSEVQQLRSERERWDDQTFIITQARERLYYVMPGEVSYLVIDDRTEAAKLKPDTAVSSKLTEAKGDWMRSLLGSVMSVGLSPDASVPGEAP